MYYSNSLKAAYEKKQAAASEMGSVSKQIEELKSEMHDLYVEIGQLQVSYDEACSENNALWQSYLAQIRVIENRITEKTVAEREAKDLEERFDRLQHNAKNPASKELYLLSYDFFKNQKDTIKNEISELFEKKKDCSKPDTSKANALLNVLKEKRAKQKELKDRFALLKEEFIKKKKEYEDLKNEYIKIKNEEANEKFLKEAKIPKKYWEGSVVKQRADETHILYGGDETHAHGHVVLTDGNTVFNREPRPFSNAVINS